MAFLLAGKHRPDVRFVRVLLLRMQDSLGKETRALTSERAKFASFRGMEDCPMPETQTLKRAERDLREGKSPSTAAGEFVHEEIEHVREGKHGARSPQQAIAIGLSKARRAGVPLPPPKRGKTKESTRKSAERAYKAGQSGGGRSPNPRASRARERVLEQEPHSSASRGALSRQARRSSRERGAEARHRAADKAVQTKGKSQVRQAAKKAARTRASHGAVKGDAANRSKEPMNIPGLNGGGKSTGREP